MSWQGNIYRKFQAITDVPAERKSFAIHHFPMLVATGNVSPEKGLPVKFCVDFNHFKSIVMSALLHCKTL